MNAISNHSIPEKSEKVNSNERNSKISEENSIGWEDLKKSLPETDDAGYYDDLQIEAKPPKKAQEQKHGVGNERKFFTNSKTGIANDAHMVFYSKKD